MYTKLGLRLALGCLLSLGACSGDDDDKKDTVDAGGEPNGRDAAAGGGAQGTGSGKEGVECTSHSQCASGLSCLAADARIADLKVCARPCGEDGECDSGERCWSPTGKPAEAFCWNTEGEALKSCGPAFTALCDEEKNLGCLRVEDDKKSVAGGVCLQPCKLNEDDACSGGLSCLDIINQDDGLCVRTVERGDECDEPKGEFCEAGNMCLNDGTTWRCYQDCSESDECDDGKECKPLQNDQGKYCE